MCKFFCHVRCHAHQGLGHGHLRGPLTLDTQGSPNSPPHSVFCLLRWQPSPHCPAPAAAGFTLLFAHVPRSFQHSCCALATVCSWTRPSATLRSALGTVTRSPGPLAGGRLSSCDGREGGTGACVVSSPGQQLCVLTDSLLLVARSGVCPLPLSQWLACVNSLWAASLPLLCSFSSSEHRGV